MATVPVATRQPQRLRVLQDSAASLGAGSDANLDAALKELKAAPVGDKTAPVDFTVTDAVLMAASIDLVQFAPKPTEPFRASTMFNGTRHLVAPRQVAKLYLGALTIGM